MEALSEKIITNIIKSGESIEDCREVYVYGLTQLFRTLLNLFTTVIIGFCMGMLSESIVFVICLMLIRSYSGGYHSDSPIRCYLISVIAVIMALGSIKLSVWNEYSSVLVMVISNGILLLYAPIGHRNKPLEDIEVLVYKRRLKWILLALTVTFMMFVLVNWITLSYVVSSAVLLSAVMLLVAKMDNWFSCL
ncbi:MAG: accessory gene regulator ArgB-like protein [Peptoanaerobacter stomatis]|uniref:accessory gene regulator ArgB-like protein n=1 Tax=Clostridia TaxID=186801 RepID=UPI003F9FB1CE